jgi:hypothetical protein
LISRNPAAEKTKEAAMTIHKIEQGSREWRAARIGIPTASNFHKILTPSGKPAKAQTTRASRLQLVVERLLNVSLENEVRVLMLERGKLLQADAAREFSAGYDLELEPGGFVTNDDLRIGCSPDALVTGGTEAVKIKCPAPPHVARLSS